MILLDFFLEKMAAKMTSFPGKDLISLKPRFLMENPSMQCFPPAWLKEQVSREAGVTCLPGTPAASRSSSGEGKLPASCLGQGAVGRDGRTPAWILPCLVRADAEPSVRQRGMGSPTAAGFVPSFVPVFTLPSCQTKSITAGLNCHTFIQENFKNACF